MCVWLVTSTTASFVGADEHRGRVLLTTPTRGWQAFDERVVQELTTSGFEVQRGVLDNDGTLQARLRRAVDEHDAVAGIAAERGVKAATVLVWVTSSRQLHRAETREVDAPFVAGTMALRVVELLTLGDLNVHFEQQGLQSTPPRPSTPVVSPVHDAPLASERSRLWTSVGAGFSSGMSSPSLPIWLEFEQSLAARLSLQLGVTSEAVALRTGTALGEVTTRSSGFGAMGLWTVASTPGVWFDVGIGGAALSVVSEGEPSSRARAMRDSTWVFAPWIAPRIRGPIAFGLCWHVTARAGMMLPNVRLRSGDQVLTSIGRPLGYLAGGLGWEF